MSKQEYAFHHINSRRNHLTAPSAQLSTQVPITPKGIKHTILDQYDRFVQLKQTDSKIRYLAETQEKISKEIIAMVGLLQNTPDVAKQHQLNNQLNHLTDLHNNLKTEYTQLLKTEFSQIADTYPGIFDKLIEGVDRNTLEHVLTVFDEYGKGNLNSKEAVTQGIDYMTAKYHLPPDFFNKDAIDQYNQSLHKPTS